MESCANKARSNLSDSNLHLFYPVLRDCDEGNGPVATGLGNWRTFGAAPSPHAEVLGQASGVSIMPKRGKLQKSLIQTKHPGCNTPAGPLIAETCSKQPVV